MLTADTRTEITTKPEEVLQELINFYGIQQIILSLSNVISQRHEYTLDPDYTAFVLALSSLRHAGFELYVLDNTL